MSDGGDCYQAALVYALSLATSEREAHRVCHGEPLGQGPIEGVRHGHAWVERVEVLRFPDRDIEHAIVVCIDKSNGNDATLPAELYYKVGDIAVDEVERYTVDEAWTLALEHGHYGPWHEPP